VCPTVWLVPPQVNGIAPKPQTSQSGGYDEARAHPTLTTMGGRNDDQGPLSSRRPCMPTLPRPSDGCGPRRDGTAFGGFSNLSLFHAISFSLSTSSMNERLSPHPFDDVVERRELYPGSARLYRADEWLAGYRERNFWPARTCGARISSMNKDEALPCGSCSSGHRKPGGKL